MITSLKMVNWRAYEHRQIEFGQGINFLMGSNGSGKTSILEAIAFALTGEAAFFQKGERSNLLRNPEKPGTVSLVIGVDQLDYEIMRTQNPGRAGEAYIKRLNDGKYLAQTQGGVTKQVEKLLGISDDFLRRIIYMAEGDVFNFISNPPRDALDIQIRSVLGLTQLDEFATALKASEKQLKNRLAELQALNADLIRLEIRSIHELEEKLKGGNVAREQFLAQLEQTGRELAVFEQNTNAAQSIQSAVNDLRKSVETFPDVWQGLEGDSVLSYFDGLQNKLRAAETQHGDIKLMLARLDGQEEAYRRVLDLLEPLENSDETAPCPVCRKPLTQSERKTVLDEIRQDVRKLELERRGSEQHQEQTLQSVHQFHEQVSQLQPLRNLLIHTTQSAIQPSQPFAEVVKAVAESGVGKQSEKQAALIRQSETIRERLKELEVFTAEYQVIKNRLRDFGFHSPEDLGQELVQLEIRMLSLRAASQAIEETLESQQNNEMKTIYEQIADLWASFRGEDDWEMEYIDGYPVMIKGEEKLKLDLRQLSGGEKTALLIQLHTILAHHFSYSDFLMIDEPLEHLDPINRRSLIKFLVDAHHHHIFEQAIIATFEESLIRKYQSNPGVSIVLV